ncbi:hypothetical protein HID58_073825, partial [Brassica napus]
NHNAEHNYNVNADLTQKSDHIDALTLRHQPFKNIEHSEASWMPSIEDTTTITRQSPLHHQRVFLFNPPSMKQYLILELVSRELNGVVQAMFRSMQAQEDEAHVKLEQGLKIVKIFKEHTSKICILNDFSFYEKSETADPAHKESPRLLKLPVMSRLLRMDLFLNQLMWWKMVVR